MTVFAKMHIARLSNLGKIVWFHPHSLSRVWYRLVQVVKILTVRFSENLGIGVIQGQITPNCEKVTWIMIHDIFICNKNEQRLCQESSKCWVFIFSQKYSFWRLSNSYTMGCPHVRGDNPRALASGLSYVQVDKHGITILYHQHQCRACTSRDISYLRW